MNFSFQLTPFLQGMGISGGFLIAIGAQTACVIKQGLLNQYVFLTAIFCSICDAFLIGLGIAGMGEVLTQHPLILQLVRWGGVCFLLIYGARSFWHVLNQKGLKIDVKKHISLKKTLTTLFAVSLLNPHAYLDTVILLGGIAAQFEKTARFSFAGGAILVSFIWFFSLAYGASSLRHILAKPLIWKILDIIVGIMMWIMALFFIMNKN